MGKKNKPDVGIEQSHGTFEVDIPVKGIDHKKEIEKERKERSDRCAKRVQEVLNEENCTMDVQMIITTAGNRPVANIVCKD